MSNFADIPEPQTGLPPDASDSSEGEFEEDLDSDFDSPTGDSTVEYPATQLVKELLPYVSAYEEFGRHVNLSRQLNTRSKATYQAINQLIAKFLTTEQSFDDTFSDFDTSSKAIPVLERLVLFLLDIPCFPIFS
jgi:hypothetical protein